MSTEEMDLEERFFRDDAQTFTRKEVKSLMEIVTSDTAKRLAAERDYYKERCEAAEKLVDVWIDQPPFGTGYDLDRWWLWRRERLQPQTKILSELKSKQP